MRFGNKSKIAFLAFIIAINYKKIESIQLVKYIDGITLNSLF